MHLLKFYLTINVIHGELRLQNNIPTLLTSIESFFL